MKLNDDHISILMQVHNMMHAALWGVPGPSRFICVNITRVLEGRYGDEWQEIFPHLGLLRDQLTSAIDIAIGGRSTMCIYLRHVVPGFSRLSGWQQEDLTRLARVAWLRRMIDTREIVPIDPIPFQHNPDLLP